MIRRGAQAVYKRGAGPDSPLGISQERLQDLVSSDLHGGKASRVHTEWRGLTGSDFTNWRGFAREGDLDTTYEYS